MLFFYAKQNFNFVKSYVQSINPAYLVVLLIAGFYLIPDAAFAQNQIEETLCAVVAQLSGPVGRAIAAIAIIFLGLSLFLGKISWGIALALAIGIGAVFGAEQLVSLLGGGDENACADVTQ